MFSSNPTVETDRRDEVASRPEVLAGEVLLSPAELARDLDRALTLQVPDHIRHRVLRRNADAHVGTSNNPRFSINPAAQR